MSVPTPETLDIVGTQLLAVGAAVRLLMVSYRVAARFADHECERGDHYNGRCWIAGCSMPEEWDR